MSDEKEGSRVNESQPNPTSQPYHATLEDATAWALNAIAASGANVEWLRKAKVPMFLRDKTPDEQKLLERIVLLEDGLRRLVNQADMEREDLLASYVRMIVAELGVK